MTKYVEIKWSNTDKRASGGRFHKGKKENIEKQFFESKKINDSANPAFAFQVSESFIIVLFYKNLFAAAGNFVYRFIKSYK